MEAVSSRISVPVQSLAQLEAKRTRLKAAGMAVTDLEAQIATLKARPATQTPQANGSAMVRASSAAVLSPGTRAATIDVHGHPALGLVTHGVSDIFAPLADVPWLVPMLKLAPGRPAMLAGYGFSGKTIAAQEIAISVASGRRVFDLFTCRQGKVLHIDMEQGRRMTFERYQRLARAKGIQPSDLGDMLRVAIHADLDLTDPRAEDLLCAEVSGYALVIIDSLTAALPGVDENSRDIALPLYMLGRVSERTGCVFLVIHHARKPSNDRNGNTVGSAVMSIRGSSAIFGACDSIFVFGAAKGEPIRVEHVRSPTDGIIVNDFGMAVEDVELDGDRRAGLRLRHLEPEQIGESNRDRDAAKSAKKEERGHAQNARAADAIVAVLQGAPDGVETWDALYGAVQAKLGTCSKSIFAAGLASLASRVVKAPGRRASSTIYKLSPGVVTP